MTNMIAGLMQQAQKMQEKVQQAQQELAKIEVLGEAGAGLVQVLMSGLHEVRRVSIDRELMADDPEMAEDLVAAATNDAINKVAEISKQQMSEMTGGLQLPAGFKLPF